MNGDAHGCSRPDGWICDPLLGGNFGSHTDSTHPYMYDRDVGEILAQQRVWNSREGRWQFR